MKNPPRLVPKGRPLRRRRRSRRQTAASAMTLPWRLSSQALYLLRVWHKHLPNGHLNGHGISVAPYKPARHAKEQRAQQAAAATAACPHHAAPAIFEIRIAEFMLCVPQSEAVASALLVPMSNTHTHTQTETHVEPGERNRNNKNFASAESVQWLSLGASWQAPAPLEASNEALSKFGRSCRWQLLTCQLFESLQVARSSKHQIRDNVKHFLSNLWLRFDVVEVPLKSEIIMKEMKINNFDYLKFKYKE